ncbi:class I adenylate-forming enzyme family protein [Azospirillum agricola]|uniref:class I adenylate-forming enzyme family protein n=1 Tax=Azospirillum agricola TaxID=1720247 RepID=UPI000A0F0657|nr:AMP-binding protein [Azospirillum agricola]SMH38689.1 fatty-acyl-CoA synthase [Azospirillum lipoferum]
MLAAPSYRQRQLTESHWPADQSRPLLDWTLGDALRHAAATVPDRMALVEGRADRKEGRRWTYAGLLAESERVAAALLTRFRPGERVAFWADNVPEWLLAFYGCALAGIVLVTVNPAYKAREMRYVLEKSEAAGLFLLDGYRGYDMPAAVADVRDTLPALRHVIRIADFADFAAAGTLAAPTPLPAVTPLDPCVIMFTSGTTGAQKGVMFHHRGVLNMSLFTQERGGLAEGGVFVNPMPMFHIGALGHAGVGAVARRATHVLAAEWEPTLFMSLVAREGGTYSLLVPTMIEAILAHPDRPAHDLSTLRNLTSGASVVEASLIRRANSELGCTICNIYGQTEMQGVITGVHPGDGADDKAGTIGRPMPQVEVKIADPESGAVLPLGSQGEIWMRGYQTMLGYFNMPEETAKTLRPDGWLRSGDLGSMDERGFLRITGRIKDMIIRGGENIYPREIEELLIEHPKIAQVAVVGAPDPYWGEQVCAVIQPQAEDDPPDAAELFAFCRSQLAAYKAPRLWYIVKELPHTETGKLQKFKLVEAIRQGALSPPIKT